VVTVVVGSGAHQVTFYPHEAALILVRFFNTALTGPFQVSEDFGGVTLSETRVAMAGKFFLDTWNRGERTMYLARLRMLDVAD
jgi:hypothetical protein